MTQEQRPAIDPAILNQLGVDTSTVTQETTDNLAESYLLSRVFKSGYALYYDLLAGKNIKSIETLCELQMAHFFSERGINVAEADTAIHRIIFDEPVNREVDFLKNLKSALDSQIETPQNITRKQLQSIAEEFAHAALSARDYELSIQALDIFSPNGILDNQKYMDMLKQYINGDQTTGLLVAATIQRLEGKRAQSSSTASSPAES